MFLVKEKVRWKKRQAKGRRETENKKRGNPAPEEEDPLISRYLFKYGGKGGCGLLKASLRSSLSRGEWIALGGFNVERTR